jgi:SAM-dependent methyltransferase
MTIQFKEFVKTLENPFCYYAYLTDREGLLDYFHFGLWEDGTRGLKEAQENLASLMKSLIPGGVKRILDVGCGLGRTTYDLTSAGYDVIGISPDIRLLEMAKAKYQNCSSRFILSSFEDYRSADSFDLILFQESSQYIKDLNFLFSHCNNLLNKKGSILMCDEIRYENFTDAPLHEKKKLKEIAHKYGFNMVHNENITGKVLKTLNLALRLIAEHRNSIIEELSPVREKAGQEIDALFEGWKSHAEMFDLNIFGYEVFLFHI